MSLLYSLAALDKFFNTARLHTFTQKLLTQSAVHTVDGVDIELPDTAAALIFFKRKLMCFNVREFRVSSG